ncbi:Protein SCAI [Dillenia turbinata]|uniref:Protein SCAI n=1 Tax=Dillenia turbinata TaxID=194707 RepID=A0AAN8UVB0_9MAGN
MTQSQTQQNSNIPLSEVYWSMVDQADKKFSKIRDLPCYDRHRYDLYFFKAFKVYTQLWKFQQENRQKLVEAGLKRWEIGEIASRIAQLYYGQYLRTSEASYLSESYIFYEAIFSREYFKEGMFQDLNLANKQLRFLARFLMVCLVLNRREMVHQLVSQLKLLVDECKRTFQETDFREWKQVAQEILRFLKADTAFMNIRPLRYSFVLDTHPEILPHLSTVSKRNLRLRDAILSSYHPNEVKFSELTIDSFRMLQCLEWEPSGSFYQPNVLSSETANIGQNGGMHTRANYMQDITDPTLPSNPRKAILYRPSATHFIAVLATICEELPPDGVLLIYLSASGRGGQTSSSPPVAATCSDGAEKRVHSIPSHTCSSEVSSPSSISPPVDNQDHSVGQDSEDCMSNHIGCLIMGARGNEGLNCIYPCDLLPFTRRPLFLLLLNLHVTPVAAYSQVFLRHRFRPSVSCLDVYNKADKLLSSSLYDWEVALAASENLNPVWAQILSDPFLRRLLLRFIFCAAVLNLYAPTFGKKEFLPECVPCLPESVSPTTSVSKNVVLQLASIFNASERFLTSEANGFGCAYILCTVEESPSEFIRTNEMLNFLILKIIQAFSCLQKSFKGRHGASEQKIQRREHGGLRTWSLKQPSTLLLNILHLHQQGNKGGHKTHLLTYSSFNLNLVPRIELVLDSGRHHPSKTFQNLALAFYCQTMKNRKSQLQETSPKYLPSNRIKLLTWQNDLIFLCSAVSTRQRSSRKKDKHAPNARGAAGQIDGLANKDALLPSGDHPFAVIIACQGKRQKIGNKSHMKMRAV